ncbi:hypothetical protein EDD21DRAFT_372700 [Dissophora ornata]|nr:hypothetical protein EDD21DRAFT_372700 [Dissophora ornata]
MTDFAQDRQALRSRGPSLPKLNLLPSSHFLQQQLQQQSQHPFDAAKPNDADFELDMDMDFDTAPSHDPQMEVSGISRPFVSAHPSPDVSDESDSEHGLGQGPDESDAQQLATELASSAPALSSDHGLNKRRPSRGQSLHEPSLSHHLFLAPVPIPSSRTPPHSPHFRRKQSSFSMSTPPGSATSVLPAPCTDSATLDAIIREHVHSNMVTHATDKGFFWHLGKLSEFSFSDRFVRSRIFETKDSVTTPDPAQAVAIEGPKSPISANQQGKSSWRLRLYPHGRGDRHRDSEYVGLYLQQEGVRPIMNRRSSAISTVAGELAFSSSAPTPFFPRGSISSSPRKSISGASSLPMVRRHVTLFIATENGDCLAKQDLIEWFSGSEGGLGFPRLVSRKVVQDAVKSSSIIDDEEEDNDLSIVAGVIFHEL